MNCPHTWFSTEFRGGKSLVRRRLRDLLRPAPRRGRALAAAAAVLLLRRLMKKRDKKSAAP